MQFGNDFILRMTGASSYQLPRKKDDVDDVKFASVFGMIGEHNKFIDISRCRKISLSSFEKIKQCSSLLYLDVSYTIVDTYFLSILQQHCNRLRGIMLGGSQIVDYSPLALVDSLEIISLRNSAVVSLDWISGLFRLRSLDLGSTQVLSLYPLSGLTRLEELCIDECLHVESSESNLGLFSRLPSLQLLNSADSSLVSFGSLISSSCDFNVCIESNPRKIRFLQAIIDNDYTTAHWLIGSGQDINIRIGPWADALLLRSWKSRCKYSRISTPLVQPSFTNEQLRPTPLHISLLFNSLEIIRDLVESGADLKARCWYGEVKEDSFENKLVEDKSKASKLVDGNEFVVKDFVRALYTTNIHRYTEKMADRKVKVFAVTVRQWH